MNQLHLWVLILNWFSRYEASLRCISECRQVLLWICVWGWETGNHQAVGVTTDALLQEARQLWVSVRYVLESSGTFLEAGSISKSCYYLSQCEEWLVDVYWFLLSKARCPSDALTLTPCEVDELELTYYGVVNGWVVYYVDGHCEYWMGARRGVVQVVRGDDFVFDTLVVEKQCMLRCVTFEHIEVFNCKLFILVPADPQSLIRGFTFLKLRSIEQVKHLFIIDLQEWAWDCDMFLFS